ncbi:hypothetical protein [Nostoc sp.]|uniref:hypothetical protein n=1 Tax=Nostoc sp. TaxID=1180 RepID=UPI003FA56098
MLDLGIVVAAGGISGYAKIETKISGSLAVTAISHNKPLCVYTIALIPPSVRLSLGCGQENLSHRDK